MQLVDSFLSTKVLPIQQKNCFQHTKELEKEQVNHVSLEDLSCLELFTANRISWRSIAFCLQPPLFLCHNASWNGIYRKIKAWLTISEINVGDAWWWLTVILCLHKDMRAPSPRDDIPVCLISLEVVADCSKQVVHAIRKYIQNGWTAELTSAQWGNPRYCISQVRLG